MRATLQWLSAVMVCLAWGKDASAFCRSTTCEGSCPIDGNGCKAAGMPLFWRSQCVGFSLDAHGTVNLPFEEVKPVLLEAFQSWGSGLPCGTEPASFVFSYSGEVSCQRAEINRSGGNANIVLFQDSKWIYSGVDNTLAKTTVTYDNETGEIVDADMEINFANNQFVTSGVDEHTYDMLAVVTHEVGHFIGIDHSNVEGATMESRYDPGSTSLRSLEDDDLAALCTVYPPGRDAPCDTTPYKGFSRLCSEEHTPETSVPDPLGGCSLGAPSSSASRWGAALAALGLAYRRRSRRCRSNSAI